MNENDNWNELSNALSFSGNTRKTKPVVSTPKNIDATKAHEIRMNCTSHREHMDLLGDKDMAMADYLKGKGLPFAHAIGRVYVCGLHNEAMRLSFSRKTGRDNVICAVCKEFSQ